MDSTKVKARWIPRSVIRSDGSALTLNEHGAYLHEREKLADLLHDADDPANAIRQAYELPTSSEHLGRKRAGLYGIAGGRSVFAGGLTDYAHALLASWYVQHDRLLFTDQSPNDSFSKWYEESKRTRKLVTTSFYRLKPFDATQEVAPYIESVKEGLVLRGKQTFLADALFVDELLVWIQEAGETAPSTVVLLPVNDKNVRFRVSSHLDVGVAVEYDSVLIPWSRVLVERNSVHVNERLRQSKVSAIADFQWTARQTVLLESLIGTTFALAEEGGHNGEHHVQVTLGEIIQEFETVQALLLAAEIGGEPSDAGYFLPALVPLQAAKQAAVGVLDRVFEQARRIGGSLIAGNPHIDAGSGAKLGWALDAVGSERAYRQFQHELYAFGDPIRQTLSFYEEYGLEALRSRYQLFWKTRRTKDSAEKW
ncbi:4-hydroxyphenylacetate 3-hydroxylase C-terminal domain-containing protein [Paenibacillus sp. N3.4]|uniref:4-hydroxyphenylacetate 3-hydroxylase C-terminal domain-containing protein n=1 Tax=Paenibacillus sp. N3.4 TaxID=2603222 RepID=UPI0011C98763|nr:4-hydroxyphenylacetate 3-hydroxylase C-terminal domain-containing protein [Paenibacillus sp. N3.4]TXK83876.1 hypothetical protein FU659_11500 [Paenibacillus sp. N3.4]